MAAQDVKNYADENWNQYLESITELSKEQKGNALVTSDRQMYNFDKIIKENLRKKIKWCANVCRCISVFKKHIQFVEFKSGFKKKITKNTMDKEKAKCDKTNAFCNDYWNLFFKNSRDRDHRIDKFSSDEGGRQLYDIGKADSSNVSK